MDGTGRAAYDEFARTQWPRLVRAAVVLGCDLHGAEDLARAALVRCYTLWPRVARADDPPAYAAKVLINLHRQQRRRRWHGEHPTADLPEHGSEHDTDDADGTEDVRRALAGLSREHREVVVLRVHLDLPEKQAAALLRIPPGTVKSRLARALARLAADPALTAYEEGTR